MQVCKLQVPFEDDGLTNIDITKANKQGQFFSVDSRPLSTSRGIGQDVAKLFKSYVRAAASRNEAAKSVTDPFLCLQLKCPRGAYDVNIEPGKDDVLFGDRELVLGMMESLFRDHYGPLPDAQKASPKKTQKPPSASVHRDSGFDILMSRTRREIPSSRPGPPEITIGIAPASPLSQRIDQFSGPLSPDYSRAGKCPNATSVRAANAEDGGSRSINPWSISRINASFQTPQRQHFPQSSSSQTGIRTPQHDNRQQDDPSRSVYHSPPESPELTSSSALRPASISPVARKSRSRLMSESSPQMDSILSNARKSARQRDKERYGNGALDTLFQRTTGPSLAQGSPQPTTEQDVPIPTLSELAQEGFQPQSGDGFSNRVVDLEIREPRVDESQGSESQVSPGHVGSLPLGQSQEHQGSINSGRGFPVLENWAASLHKDANADTSQDLEWALDFETRKREVNQRNRTRSGGRDGQQNSHHSASAGPSPHKNRYLAAKAALAAEIPSVVGSVLKTSLSPHDPRAYFMHHRSQSELDKASEGSTKLRRLHTSRLPFESTPQEHDTHDICLPLSSDLSLISKSFNLTRRNDGYIQSGKEADIFSESDKESVLSFWNDRLIAIIKQGYKTSDESQSLESKIDVASTMRQHSNQFHAN